jgi:hypothetical protein
VVQLAGGDLTVDPGPPALGGRKRGAEQPLGPAAQVIVGRLVDVERERLVVGVGVPDGQAAVQALDQQQLGPGRRGGRRLGRQPVPAGQLVGRVVASGRTASSPSGSRRATGLVLDNTRVLHARTGFAATGGRHLQGCYADLDRVSSALALLRRTAHA